MSGPSRKEASAGDVQARLKSFDQTTKRQRKRTLAKDEVTSPDRGWTREALYTRARAH